MTMNQTSIMKFTKSHYAPTTYTASVVNY